MKKGGLLILLTGTLFTPAGEATGLVLGDTPIDLSGSLGMRFREVITDSDEGSFHQAYTGELLAQSYLWEPWFGTWKGRIASSWEKNDSTDTTTNEIVSGAGEINLFHLSRFPFAAYVDVRDSRVDDSDLVDPGSEERYSRYGIRQSYRPLSGQFNLNLNLLHDEREDLRTGDKEVGSRGIASGFYHEGAHQINVSLLANDRKRSIVQDTFQDWQTDLNHVYTPNPRFSLTSNIGASSSEGENERGRRQSTQERLATNMYWRAETLPLSLRGDIYWKSDEIESDLLGDQIVDETRGNLSLTYLPTLRWRLRLSGGAQVRTGDVDEKRTFQAASANYSSTPIGLGSFAYSYGGGLGYANETNSNAEGEKIARASLSHNLNRSWITDWWSMPLGASLTFGQDYTYEDSSIQDVIETLVHRVSYNLRSTGNSATTHLNLVFYDTRNSGRNDLVVQNASISVLHNQRLSRYSDFGISYSANLTRQSGDIATVIVDDPFTDEDESEIEDAEHTTLEIFYHHNRLFRIRNMRFGSRLQTSTNTLLLDQLNDEPSSEWLWENRIDYAIGKLDIDFRTTWVMRPAEEGTGTKTIVLNIRRLF